MDITTRALQRIKQLKDRQGVGRTCGLRLGLKEDRVYLKWAPSGPGAEDLIETSIGFPLFINALDHARLSDYVLDFETANGSSRFLLRPRSASVSGKSERRARGGNHNVRRIKQ